VAVILISHNLKMNPDNLATPLAASIGDVVSISLLSFIASVLFEHLGEDLFYFFTFDFTLISDDCFLQNRYTSLGDFRRNSMLLYSVTILDINRHPEQIHASCTDQRLGTGIDSALHQWVR
jgi:hypothetical protein